MTVQAQIVNLLAGLQASEDLAMVFISHDMAVVRHLSDRIMVMYLGRVMEEGTAEKVFNNPLHPYTKALLDAIPGADKGRRHLGREGQMPSPSGPPTGCQFQTRCPATMGEICDTTRPALVQVEEGHKVACLQHTEPIGIGTEPTPANASEKP